MRIYGVDFTCAPRKAKPITVAAARLKEHDLLVEAVETLESFAAFEVFLARRGPWVGGFDFPFGMPQELIRDLEWPAEWKSLVGHCAAMTRNELRAVLNDYRASRPIGKKYAHRATDRPAGSSSPMKLVNPPVALMFHEGAPRLLGAGVHVPALADGDRERVALEAYPGLLARKQLRISESYKSDARSEHTPGRKAVRQGILQALKAGKPLGVTVNLPQRLEREILRDGSGDLLDALICATQAAWAARQANYGLPAEGLRGEGWIVSASAPKSSNLGSTVTPS